MSRSEDMENPKNVDNNPVLTGEQIVSNSKAVAFAGNLITYIDHEEPNEGALREESIHLGKEVESREVKVDDKKGEKKDDSKEDINLKNMEKSEERGDTTESSRTDNPSEKKQYSESNVEQDRRGNGESREGRDEKSDGKKGKKNEDSKEDNESDYLEKNDDITDSAINPLKKDKYPKAEEEDSCGMKCFAFAVECCNCIIL